MIVRHRFLFRRVLSLFPAVLMGILALVGAARAETTVRIGTASTSTDVGFYIADKKGYFKQEGINVTLIPFDSAAKMVAPLGVGQLDVGGGSASSALYNAVARGVNVKIVADKGSAPPGHGFMALIVRKDLVTSGRYKSYKDLKGLKVASGATGISNSVTLSEALKQGGLSYADVSVVNMGYPQHVMALQNKAVDAGVTVEPSVTQAVQSGAAVRVAGDDVIYPNHQIAVVLYSGNFIKDNPDVAKRFMRAYIKAVRDYNDALTDGRLAGPKAAEVVSILTEYTNIKDANVYRSIVPHGTNPDGRVNEASLKKDFQFYKEQGLIEGNVAVEQVIDASFVEAALKDLGTYAARRK